MTTNDISYKSDKNIKEEPICFKPIIKRYYEIYIFPPSQDVIGWGLTDWGQSEHCSSATLPSLIKILGWLQTRLIRLFIMSAQGESFHTGSRPHGYKLNGAHFHSLIPLDNTIHKYRCRLMIHKQHSRHSSTSVFPAVPHLPHLPRLKDKAARLPFWPSSSSPFISSRLAWSVSECLPAITLSDRRTISESSVTPLPLCSRHLQPAGTPHATQQSHCKWGEAPCLLKQGKHEKNISPD